MAMDWNQVRENNRTSEAEHRDREAIEGARLNHKLSESEAAFLVGRRKFEAAEREQQEHTKDQLAFANHCINRAVEAKKQGHPRISRHGSMRSRRSTRAGGRCPGWCNRTLT